MRIRGFQQAVAQEGAVVEREKPVRTVSRPVSISVRTVEVHS